MYQASIGFYSSSVTFFGELRRRTRLSGLSYLLAVESWERADGKGDRTTGHGHRDTGYGALSACSEWRVDGNARAGEVGEQAQGGGQARDRGSGMQVYVYRYSNDAVGASDGDGARNGEADRKGHEATKKAAGAGGYDAESLR